MQASERWKLYLFIHFIFITLVTSQPAERIPSVDPNHYLPSNNPCYDQNGIPQRCVPDFINVAFNLPVNVSNTCGIYQPTRYCVQSGAMGHMGIRKVCDICDARLPAFAHPAEYLTDFNNPENETWWQSETMNEGVQYPNNVTLTITFGKAFDITYVRLKFISPRPESFTIYKKTTADGEWIPWQYYSGSCKSTYKMPEKAPILPGNEAVAQCTREFSDISPLTGGNIAYSTLDGRPSAENFEESEVLQEWVTAVAVRIVLNRLNTFGDEVFRDPRVLKSYYYAISDLAIGGRCKCNGHASQCVSSTGHGQQALVCDCKHHTAGADCGRCEVFYQDRPWRAATSEEANECLPCNCNGLSQRCYFDEKLYEETGHGGHCIDCAGNTHGPHCEHCSENHWRRPGEHFCVPCQCNEKASVSQQCNSEGQCECKPGVTGQRCDQCKAGFYDFTSTGCKDCHCDVSGSWDNEPRCSPHTGDCQCKEKVEGRKCDKCKPGYFNLSPQNRFGCTPCFCYGHSSVCSASEGYYAVNITSTFTEDHDHWSAKSDRQFQHVQHAQIDQAIAITQEDNLAVYFLAPEKFLGDQRLAFNQEMSFTLRVQQDRGVPSKKDVVLVGASGLELSLPIFAQGNPYPLTKDQRYTFRIHPSLEWVPTLKEIDFIGVLSNLTAIKIRGTYSPGDVGFLSDFTFGTASMVPDSELSDSPIVADWIETCNCTEGFVGQFCESCAPGYRRVIKYGGPLTKCIKCDCHGHSDSCDPESGACICQHNTSGDTCEVCARGYYGNALNGTENDCRKCDCPENGPCVLLSDGTTFCTECPTGYTGKKCDQCADEYYGNPLNDIPCKSCQCNNNTDINSIGNCDVITGECRKCIYHTTGFNCEKCEAGYWGNALSDEFPKCKSCNCYPPGTKKKDINLDLLECNQETGQCDCLPNIEGLQCDTVVVGYFNITSGIGGQDCECDPLGSLNKSCNIVTGQCMCKPGVTGRKCDQCADRHYGFSLDGCKPCDCDLIGSESADCDVKTGQCLCKDNVEGRRCDMCSENRYNMRSGCLPCDDCYTLIQTRKNDVNKTIEQLEENLDEIQNHPISIDDPEFETKIKEAQDKVEDLIQVSLEKLNKDDSKALLRTINDLKSGLEEAKDSLKKVNPILSNFDNKAVIINSDIKRFNIDKDKVQRELDYAIEYAEIEGKTHLNKAKDAADKYGDKSQKMSDLADESKKLSDKHIEIRNKVKDLTEKIINNTLTAAIEAKDAIFGPSETSQQIETLKNELEKTIHLLNQTKQLATEEHEKSEKAYNDAVRALSDVQDLKLPNIIIENYKTDAKNYQELIKDAETNANNLFNDNQETLSNANSAITDAKDVLNQAQLAANETERELQTIKDATKRAQDAYDNATNTWNEANDSLKALENFQENIDSKKDEAITAMEDVDKINEDIKTAQETSQTAESAIGDAKNDAEKALKLATEAKEDVEKIQQLLTELENGLEGIDTSHDETQELFDKVKESLDNLAVTTQNFENQAVSDHDKADDALKKASRAEANAKNLSQHLTESEKKLIDASRLLNALEDVNDDELDRLEKLLEETEKKYLEAEEAKQSKIDEDKRMIQERDILRRDVTFLQEELENLRNIYESLPAKCFNKVSLEQEGQK